MPPELTDAQKELVYEKTGLFVVKACPGSGKTLTVAARLHRLLADWGSRHTGIATLSFTNTAWQEVENYLARDYGVRVPLSHPHFLGTIDSFINQFIFLPFGHKVVGCSSRPELTGPPYDDHEPIGRWLFWQSRECNSNRCLLNDFTYDEDGRLVNLAPLSHFNRCQRNHDRCSVLKRTLNSKGYATQSDANYFAMRLLEEYPVLATALAHRFPLIIVDEAQDSSRTQMRILDALIEAGLTEVMLAGDPYQAIYEWRHAEPQLFEDKFAEWQENCVWLDENWRSTQSICDLACTIANWPQRVNARNPEVAAYDHIPVLHGYGDEGEIPGLLESFCQHCARQGIARDMVSILTRSREFISSVVPGIVQTSELVPWRDNDPLTRQISQAKYEFDRGDFRAGLKRLERAAYRHTTGMRVFSHQDVREHAQSVGLGNWRGQLFRLLCELPQSTGAISAWLVDANVVLSEHALLRGHTLQIKRDRRPNNYSALSFDEIFTPPAVVPETSPATAGTVHSVKGRSLEAVFLVLKSRGATGGSYTNLLGSNLLQHEELRIVYVAVTRAKKALGIAVPQSALERWRDFLFTRGTS